MVADDSLFPVMCWVARAVAAARVTDPLFMPHSQTWCADLSAFVLLHHVCIYLLILLCAMTNKRDDDDDDDDLCDG